MKPISFQIHPDTEMNCRAAQYRAAHERWHNAATGQLVTIGEPRAVIAVQMFGGQWDAMRWENEQPGSAILGSTERQLTLDAALRAVGWTPPGELEDVFDAVSGGATKTPATMAAVLHEYLSRPPSSTMMRARDELAKFREPFPCGTEFEFQLVIRGQHGSSECRITSVGSARLQDTPDSAAKRLALDVIALLAAYSGAAPNDEYAVPDAEEDKSE